jgi:hypothetical protein
MSRTTNSRMAGTGFYCLRPVLCGLLLIFLCLPTSAWAAIWGGSGTAESPFDLTPEDFCTIGRTPGDWASTSSR